MFFIKKYIKFTTFWYGPKKMPNYLGRIKIYGGNTKMSDNIVNILIIATLALLVLVIIMMFVIISKINKNKTVDNKKEINDLVDKSDALQEGFENLRGTLAELNRQVLDQDKNNDSNIEDVKALIEKQSAPVIEMSDVLDTRDLEERIEINKIMINNNAVDLEEIKNLLELIIERLQSARKINLVRKPVKAKESVPVKEEVSAEPKKVEEPKTFVDPNTTVVTMKPQVEEEKAVKVKKPKQKFEAVKMTELVSMLSESVEGSSKAEAKRFINAFKEEVIEILKQDDSVSINNFGKFHIYESKARDGINPLNGEPYHTPATKKAKFQFSTKVKGEING